LGSGFTDEDYELAGATTTDHETTWNQEMVVKVKEPLPQEYSYIKQGQILFTYIHLAADRTLTESLIKSGVTAIA